MLTLGAPGTGGTIVNHPTEVAEDLFILGKSFELCGPTTSPHTPAHPILSTMNCPGVNGENMSR